MILSYLFFLIQRQMHPSMTPSMNYRQMNPMNMQYPRGGHPMNPAYNQQNQMNMHNQNMMTNNMNVPGNHYRMVRFSLFIVRV